MSGVDIAGLVEELKRYALHDGRSTDTHVAMCAAIHRAADALLAQAAELAAKDAQINALDQERDGFAQLCSKFQDELVGERWHADEAARQRDVAIRQRDEALAALKASEWQPIETAPKDGDNILATDARLQGGFPQVVYWDTDKNSGWHQTDAEIVYHPEAFTHWQRDCLAPPPVASGPNLADATNNPPSDPGTEQREAGEFDDLCELKKTDRMAHP